ncbi:hypothetical protein ACQKWADRAFT_288143 [Trichoderma austrokoningii]
MLLSLSLSALRITCYGRVSGEMVQVHNRLWLSSLLSFGIFYSVTVRVSAEKYYYIYMPTYIYENLYMFSARII